jgi:LmbE family N-acetylglucosaminyl deacetylase
MISLPIPSKDKTFHVLCLGAHCDDVEIGCAATLMKLIKDLPRIKFSWIVFSSTEERAKEATNSAQQLLKGAESSEIEILNHRNGYFPYYGTKIKDSFENLKSRIQPNLIFTHYRNDLHQDHRLIGELTWNTFRDHWILEYEVPKYDGDFGSPNFFVPSHIDKMNKKIDVLLDCFKSQKHRSWFTRSTFESLMRLRGVECNSESGFAEAFYSRKTIFK